MKTVVFYIHGFNSGANSEKAVSLKSWCEENGYEFDAVTYNSFKIMTGLVDILKQVGNHKGKEIIFVGTSLGGFLAFVMARSNNGKCVAINPVITPSKSLAQWVDKELTNYSTGEMKTLTKTDLAMFSLLDVFFNDKYFEPNLFETITLLETGDEVLDYREAVETLTGKSEVRIFEGGNHRFTRTEEIFKAIKDIDATYTL